VDGKLFYVLGGLLPAGPWNDEPDRVEFEYAGMPCLVVRNSQGAWCGYVAVPRDHPWHCVNYDNVKPAEGDYVEVHGGLTYSAFGPGVSQQPGVEPNDVWWIGFDCNHSGDLSAYDIIQCGSSARDDGMWISYYRTVEYAQSHVKKLAEQVKAAGTADNAESPLIDHPV
jgi:hypothetical protein